MSTELVEVRTALHDTLTALVDVEVYRHRRKDYKYPCVVIGWPSSIDVRADMGMARDFVINVELAVEVVDDESSDNRLSDLLEDAITLLLDAQSTWDVQPVTDFGELLLADNRTVISCRLPVAVFS
jgi:hypothetical protein